MPYGDWSEKETIYGLGREDASMLERPSKSRHPTSGTSSKYSLLLVT